ncbi:MAG: hypothetical protein V1904_12960 [Bacteroidota bacterium]
MKKILVIIVMVAVFLTTYSQDSIKQSNNVVLTIKRKVPYCGGVVPTYEMANRKETAAYDDFIIQYQQGCGDSLWFKEFNTDSSGMISCHLPVGKYCLKRAVKKIPFDDFYKMHKKEDDKWHTYRDSTCYYNWWKSCDFTFELNDEITSIETEVLLISRCYTGEDPCIIYKGPYPP